MHSPPAGIAAYGRAHGTDAAVSPNAQESNQQSIPESNAHRIAQRGDDTRRERVEHGTIRHLRAVERKRDVEAVAVSPRNNVDVIVRLVLAGRRAAVDHDV